MNTITTPGNNGELLEQCNEILLQNEFSENHIFQAIKKIDKYYFKTKISNWDEAYSTFENWKTKVSKGKNNHVSLLVDNIKNSNGQLNIQLLSAFFCILSYCEEHIDETEQIDNDMYNEMDKKINELRDNYLKELKKYITKHEIYLESINQENAGKIFFNFIRHYSLSYSREDFILYILTRSSRDVANMCESYLNENWDQLKKHNKSYSKEQTLEACCVGIGYLLKSELENTPHGLVSYFEKAIQRIMQSEK